MGQCADLLTIMPSTAARMTQDSEGVRRKPVLRLNGNDKIFKGNKYFTHSADEYLLIILEDG